MRRLLPRLAAGLIAALAGAAPAAARFQYVFATPLPPGPGTVPIVPNSTLAAPVLLPVGAPTAAPVAIYTYGQPQMAAPAAPAATTPVPPMAPAPGSDCGPTVAGCEQPKRCGGRFWVAADFFYGASQSVWLPPLVTLAPPGAPSPGAGALYSPNGIILFGGQRELTSTRPGFRVEGGYWFDDARTSGIDASVIYLGRLNEEFIGSSGPGGVVLARPIVGPGGVNEGVPVAGPFPGGITASAGTSFIGGDVNYRRSLCCGDCCRWDLLVGYRYLHLGDTVDVWQTSVVPAANLVLPPAVTLLHDSIHTRNDFHGGQVGVASFCRLGGGFTLDLWAKVALGVTVAHANTYGTTQFPVLSPGTTFPTGLLVSATNTVADSTTYFAVAPEAGLKLGYDVTDWLRVNAGYTFLYWSKVRRAADQIDLTVGPAAGRPAFRDRTTDLWVQGWTLGVQLSF
jgi:hypothetical protein